MSKWLSRAHRKTYEMREANDRIYDSIRSSVPWVTKQATPAEALQPFHCLLALPLPPDRHLLNFDPGMLLFLLVTTTKPSMEGNSTGLRIALDLDPQQTSH